jgi:uncharacterized protein DUF4387
MTDERRPTLGELAQEVRSKNAGPFWVTMELFMRSAEDYATVADEDFINEEVIARLYELDPADIQIFRIPVLNVVKISFPRPVAQGSLRDRDVHAGQHHVPLAALVPAPESTPAQPASHETTRGGLTVG